MRNTYTNEQFPIDSSTFTKTYYILPCSIPASYKNIVPLYNFNKVVKKERHTNIKLFM